MQTKKEVKKVLEDILDRLDDVMIDYELYSKKADDLLSKARDNIEYALEVL